LSTLIDIPLQTIINVINKTIAKQLMQQRHHPRWWWRWRRWRWYT